MPQIRVISPEEPSVQLSDLLARLTPDERATVIERRLGPNAVPLDNRALANQLGNVREVGAALAQLNGGQLLLLSWLVKRPGLRASWSELTDALGDRLPAELRDAYLEDLRLWALADYDPSPKNGFFATYPAVNTAMPAGRDVRLRPHLEALNSDILAKICGSLGLEKPPTQKESRLNLLLTTLSTPSSCRAAVERLSQPAQELFAWVRERGGWIDANQMKLRVPRSELSSSNSYGSYITFWRDQPGKKTVDPLTELVRCRFLLPITPYPGSWYPPSAYVIATDVEQALSGRELLDSAPLQAPPIESAEPVDPIVPNPTNLLRDVGHLLGFVATGRCEWRQDGEPYKRSLVALGKLLGYKDGAYAELLWSLAASAQFVRRTYTGTEGRYEPVSLAEFSAQDLFNALILAWAQRGGSLSEVGAESGRAQSARARLLLLLQLLPPDTWMLKSSVEALLRFQWPMIFGPEYQYAGSPTPEPGWSSLGTMLLAHGTTADGKPVVMLPAAYQQLIGPEPGDVSAALPPWERSWIVQPDRTIVVPPNAPPDTLVDLWKVAQLQSSQGASVFRVTSDSIAAALNRDLSPTQIRELLQGGSKVPLPPTVERLIDDQGERYGRIRVGVAHTYVKTDDPALLAELRQNKKLSKLEWRDVSPGVAFIVSHDPNAVLTSLRQAGFLPVMDEPKQKAVQARTNGDGPGLRLVGGSGRQRESSRKANTNRRALLRVIDEAVETEEPLFVTWLERDQPAVASISIIDLHGDAIHAYDLDKEGTELYIPLDTILDLSSDDELYFDDEEPD
jgi:hypothetical protein